MIGAGTMLALGTLTKGLDMANNAYQAQLNRDFQATQADLSRSFQSSESQKLRDWQTQMSNTAYQRSVADLEKAGLSKLLMYGAQPPTTPTSALASGQSVAGGQGAMSNDAGSVMNSVANIDYNSAKKRMYLAELNLKQERLELEKQQFALTSAQESYNFERQKMRDGAKVGF